MRIAVSVGHGQKWYEGNMVDDPGAVHSEIGVNEYQTCKRIHRILELMLEEYRGIDAIHIPIGIPLRERIGIINELHQQTPFDLALELHLNGYEHRNVDGTECLYWPSNMVGKAWAQKIQEHLVEHLHLKDRGIKAFDDDEWERPRSGFLRGTIPTAIILESFFITNDVSAQAVVTGDLVHRTAWAIFRALTQ